VAELETFSGEERRTRDRSRGIVLRRRQRNPLPHGVVERRTAAPVNNGFDIASALELHLDQCTTRRSMLGLLEKWLIESKSPDAAERDEAYCQAVQSAIEVMRTAPDVLTGIAILQRAPEDS
jgi:hypothetical protein